MNKLNNDESPTNLAEKENDKDLKEDDETWQVDNLTILTFLQHSFLFNRP